MEKINGVSFVASKDSITDHHVKPLVELNANYAAVIPYGFIKNLKHPEIVFNTEKQWFGETKTGIEQYIKTLNKQGISIMLKPQIWVWHGEFTGQIKMDDEVGWKRLETSYSQFILDFAQLAQTMDVDIFCIGTELEKFIEHRPEYWHQLISEIRSIYNGKLTYAANWNEFESTPFWNKMNFIGIDAYFPVSNSKTPSLKECLIGWKSYKNKIFEAWEAYNKPILFTEYGYRSVDFAGRAPWKSDRSMKEVNLKAQTHTTAALFKTFWSESWFVGGFIWKWHHNHEQAGGKANSRFTPQNKPVQSLIKKQYRLNE
ncbi:glycoside hydrolase [Flavobacteriaceae bacterium GSB9]|nr:glycoside hydrolase [Flavobacteriaceae bacterium GSB9]